MKAPEEGEEPGIAKVPLKMERLEERVPWVWPEAGPARIMVKVLAVMKPSKLKTVFARVKVPVMKPSADWVATEMARVWD